LAAYLKQIKWVNHKRKHEPVGLDLREWLIAVWAYAEDEKKTFASNGLSIE
jgi:hypothetical protein